MTCDVSGSANCRNKMMENCCHGKGVGFRVVASLRREGDLEGDGERASSSTCASLATFDMGVEVSWRVVERRG